MFQPRRRSYLVPLFTFAGLMTSFASVSAKDLKITTSIKPIHSLVSIVTEGVSKPVQLLPDGQSPHDAQLKPSQAQALQEADFVFWVGETLETYLKAPIEAQSSTKAVKLIDTAKLNFPAAEDHDDHDAHKHDAKKKKAKHDGHDHDEHKEEAGHDDHKHDDHKKEDGHDEHKHDAKKKKAKHDGHDHDDHKKEASHDEHKHDEHKHDDHKKEAGHKEGEHKHDHAGHADGPDPHIWLDPANGVILANRIASVLSEADPDNAARYKSNTDAFAKRIETLMAEKSKELSAIKGQGYIIYHEAYGHFEGRFGLEHVAAVLGHDEVKPGAKSVKRLQSMIAKGQVKCLFTEPQFDAKLANTLTEGSEVKLAILDPLGVELPAGAGFYEALINDISGSLTGCLGS